MNPLLVDIKTILYTFNRIEQKIWNLDQINLYKVLEQMKNFKSFIKQFDIFGVPLQLSIQSKEKLYQSTLGGLTTFLIYIVSFLYSLQLLYLWFTQQLAPSVGTQSNPAPNGHQLELNQMLFKLNLITNGFSPEERKFIDQHYMYDYSVTVFNGTFHPPSFYSGLQYNTCGRDVLQIDYTFTSVCPNLTHRAENTLNETKVGHWDTIVFYQLEYCDPLKYDQCFGKDQLASGFGHRLIWELIVYREEVDLQTGLVFTVQKPYYIQFTNDTSKLLNIQLKITKGVVTIDTGYFFSDPRQVIIVKDVEPFITLDENTDRFKGPLITLQLEKYYYKIGIEFPQFTIVLSQIISFFQTMVLCGFLANLMNNSQMEDFMNNKLLEIYFPQFSNLIYKYNVFGKTQKVFYDEKVVDETLVIELEEKKKKILEIVQRRLNIFYLIQDVNQLQITLQMMQPKMERQSYYLSCLEGGAFNENQTLNEDDFFKFYELETKLRPRSTRMSMRTHPEKSLNLPNDVVSINID